MKFQAVLLIYIGTLFKLECVASLQLKGSWDAKYSFRFLTKFGFQRTLQTDIKSTGGYIFGNVTSLNSEDGLVTLSVLPYELFLDLYRNYTSASHMSNILCGMMFKEVDKEAYHRKCRPTGREDYLRCIPCPHNHLCSSEDNPKNVVRENQLTYFVKDFTYPKFWYVSIVACSRNQQCEWEYFNKSLLLDYDLTLVNGEPFSTRSNPFEYHFSFEKQDTVETYLVCLLLYSCFLAPVQLYATLKQSHSILKLFSIIVVSQLIGLCLDSIHLVIFSFNGIGFEAFNILGDLFNIIAQSLFMLLLLLLAKGWAIIQVNIYKKHLAIFLWASYSILSLILYFWNLLEIDAIQDFDQYHTWPGQLTLCLRVVIMFWFLLELKLTMSSNKTAAKSRFFLQFGAATLVWFIYLPATVIISTYISHLWRYKLMLGLTYSADFLAHSFMAFLLWPRRSQDYLLLQIDFEAEDYEAFNESLHIINATSSQSEEEMSQTDINMQEDIKTRHCAI